MNQTELIDILQRIEAGLLDHIPPDLWTIIKSVKRRYGRPVKEECTICRTDIILPHHINLFDKPRDYNSDPKCERIGTPTIIWICPNCHHWVHNKNHHFPTYRTHYYKSEPKPKKELVQVLNPKTKRYVLIDKSVGKILKYARTSKPYKNIPIKES